MQFVRTLGSKTHDNQEFEANLQRPAVAQKLRAFRILTCLMGLVKMLIYRCRQPLAAGRRPPVRDSETRVCRQPYLRPDMALAQKLFDYWDEQLDVKYGLPKPSPRKNVKRIENLVTMTVMNAVAHVFFFKQTAHRFEAGQVTQEYPKGKPFDVKMLWEVVQLLQPTREMIHQAWTMGLEYNIGTSSMGLTALTVLAETCGRQVGDFFNLPPAEHYASFVQAEGELTDLQAEFEGASSSHQSVWRASQGVALPELERQFSNETSTVSDDDIKRKKEKLKGRREVRARYQYLCSQSEMSSMTMKDAQKIVDDTLRDGGAPLNVSADDVAADLAAGFAADLAADIGGFGDGLGLADDAMMLEPRQAAFGDGQQQAYLSAHASTLWPDVLEAAMFYKPQTLVQFAAGKAAFVDPSGCVALGTRPCGLFQYKKRSFGNGESGASKLDIGWLQGKGPQFASWHKCAEYIKNRSNRTVMEFDLHVDGLRDLMYMCSTSDNRRRCPEQPKLESHMRPERCLLTTDGRTIGEKTVVVKINAYTMPNGVRPVDDEHEHLPRDPIAMTPDSALQRRLDSLLHGGRLSALSILTSNRIVSSPPIRMHADGIEINRGAIHSHVALLAESILTCALVPGLRNMQEAFCGGGSGPEGLSAPDPDEGSRGKRRSGKRSADGALRNSVHTLPYSYDIVGIALSIDMGSMLYDDAGAARAAAATAVCGDDLGLRLSFEDLPHLSLRFIGYAEANRQTVSIKLPRDRPDGQPKVEAGDPDEWESQISEDHVRRALGRSKISSDDMATYISRRQGARSMCGVKGDLFAASTWLQHSLNTLCDRGLMTSQRNDLPAKVFGDMEYCIHARCIEMASATGQLPHKRLELLPATPGTYEATHKKQDAQAHAASKKARRDVNNFGFDVMDIDIIGNIMGDDSDVGPIGFGPGPVRRV